MKVEYLNSRFYGVLKLLLIVAKMKNEVSLECMLSSKAEMGNVDNFIEMSNQFSSIL